MAGTPEYTMPQAIADCVAELTDVIAERYQVRMKVAHRRMVDADLTAALSQAARIADARYAAKLGRVVEPWEGGA